MTETKVKKTRKLGVKAKTPADPSSFKVSAKKVGPRVKKAKIPADLSNIRAFAEKVGGDIEFINTKLSECPDNEKIFFKSVIDDLIYLQESNLKLLEALKG